MADVKEPIGEWQDDHYSGFACACNNNPEMPKLHEFVTKTIFDGRAPEPEFYVTAMLHQLNNWDAFIEHIGTDQWGGMTVTANTLDFLVEPGCSLYIQFDRFEDGLALALKALYERYGPKRTHAPKA